MLAAMSLFVVNDVFMKLARETYPAGQAIAMRAAFAVVVGFTLVFLARESDRLAMAFRPRVVTVSADPRYLRQILHNLFTNALRHGKGEIQVSVWRDAGGAFCRVHNLAVLHAPATAPGTGLGLRIVRALVALHPGLGFKHETSAGRFIAELRWP